MPFKTDHQTLADLALFFQKDQSQSLFRYYDRTVTDGGHERLSILLTQPTVDPESLEHQKAEIAYVVDLKEPLVLNRRQFSFIEFYLKIRRVPLKDNFVDVAITDLANRIKPNKDLYIIKEGIRHLLEVFRDLKDFLTRIDWEMAPESLKQSFSEAMNLMEDEILAGFFDNIPETYGQFKLKHAHRLDEFLRLKRFNDVRTTLDLIYELDVLQSHATLIRDKGFCLPVYLPPGEMVFEAKESFHPLIKNPQKNSFYFDHKKPVCLVTGANMSGKSTFLKTIAVLTYFAHLGFPVPAKAFKMPVVNGLFTTINLPDDLSLGYSHFYAEVSRVKQMALMIREQKNVVVVLDELFRGTNVKDAFEGTLLVIDLLSKVKGSFFFISTHILEVAEALTRKNGIDFHCFKSASNEKGPVYDYILKKGICQERVGMQYIKNEEVEVILRDIIDQQKL